MGKFWKMVERGFFHRPCIDVPEGVLKSWRYLIHVTLDVVYITVAEIAWLLDVNVFFAQARKRFDNIDVLSR